MNNENIELLKSFGLIICVIILLIYMYCYYNMRSNYIKLQEEYDILVEKMEDGKP